MHVVLLSGGSGKRLWPLSNELRSKQYVKCIREKKVTVYAQWFSEFGSKLMRHIWEKNQ